MPPASSGFFGGGQPSSSTPYDSRPASFRPGWRSTHQQAADVERQLAHRLRGVRVDEHSALACHGGYATAGPGVSAVGRAVHVDGRGDLWPAE